MKAVYTAALTALAITFSLAHAETPLMKYNRLGGSEDRAELRNAFNMLVPAHDCTGDVDPNYERVLIGVDSITTIPGGTHRIKKYAYFVTTPDCACRFEHSHFIPYGRLPTLEEQWDVRCNHGE